MDSFVSVFQNFIYIPILSAVVGGILGLFVPKLVKFISYKREKNINEKADELIVAGDWNSFFNEEKVLKTETVKIEQLGREVSGDMKMSDRTYNFKGQFKNQILMCTYESKNRHKDERGTIVLRYINENLLSGYCTFIYKNRQIYNSPYILTRTSAHKVSKGTYQFCNGCVGRFDCCCNCRDIDMPILLPYEIENIARFTRRNCDTFALKKSSNLYQMKRAYDDEDRECIFFQNNKCSIYEIRPIDCRMFPFDFKEIGGEYWIIYYSKVCQAIPTNIDEIEQCAHNMRPLLEIALPYLSECSDPVFSIRLEKQKFTKLFSLNTILDDKNQ